MALAVVVDLIPSTDMPDGVDLSHPITVPDKPALEGLEAEMDRALDVRTRFTVSTAAAIARRSIRSIRRRRRSAVRCTSATSSPTPTPTSLRASSGCGARRCSIPWGGTTTGCRPSGACRILRRPLRSLAALRPGVQAAGEARQTGDRRFASEFHRAVHQADRGGREGLRSISGVISACRWTGR